MRSATRGRPAVLRLGAFEPARQKRIQIGQSLTGTAFAGKYLGQPRFNLLPGHARGQHGQRIAQVDHMVDARAEEIGDGGAGKQRGITPRNQRRSTIKPGVPPIGDHPRCSVFMRALGVVQERPFLRTIFRAEISGHPSSTGVLAYTRILAGTSAKGKRSFREAPAGQAAMNRDERTDALRASRDGCAGPRIRRPARPARLGRVRQIRPRRATG